MKFALLMVTTSAVAMTCCGTAQAQQAPVQQATGEIEYGDIVVTAQKREQKLNDVGITIVAATSRQLSDAGVKNVVDLPRIASGLTTGTTFTGFPVFSLRGVNFNSAQLATPSAVATYLDEAAVPYATQAAGLFFDLERVEVLKGPQGTLFGQNSTGGSINVIAAKPTADLSAGLTSEVNNFGQVNLEAFVSGPLSENLRVRIAGMTTQFGAWQKGYYLNRRKNGDQNLGALRFLADWQASDLLKISLNLTGSYDHGESLQAQVSLVAPGIPAAAPPGLIGYPLPRSNRDTDIDASFGTRQRNRQFMGALRADYDLSDALTFTSITDYIDTKIRNPRDADGTAIPLIQTYAGGTIKSFVQEARLSGRTADRSITYVVGMNYQKDKIFDYVTELFNGFSGFPANTLLVQPYRLTNRAIGGFGNVDVSFTDTLTLTAGLRYTSTRQTVDGCLTGNANFAATLGFIAGLANPAAASAYVPGGCLTIGDTGAAPTFLPMPSNRQQKEDNWSWRVGLNFKPSSDTLFYGLISRGYKSGTFPLTAILFDSLSRNLKQEELTSYEAGAKLSLLDRRLQVNVSAFYYDYVDKQFFTYVPVPLIGSSATFVNIPKSRAKGMDLEIVANPLPELNLRASMTYVDTLIGAFSGFNSLGSPVSFAGKEFNFAPPISATFDARYDIPLSADLKSYVGFGGVYNARTFSDLGETPATRIPARTVLDARVGLDSTNGWRVQAWVRNLTDKVYWNSLAYGGDTIIRFAGMPRTFGATFGYRF